MNRIASNLSTHCPTEADLRAFSAGRLPDARLVELADHVASCAGCQSLLETLGDQADTVVAALHELERWGSLFNEPEFKQLHSLARALDIKKLCPPPGAEEGMSRPEVSGSAETPLHASCDVADTQSSGDKAKSSGKRDETPEKIDRYFVLRRIGGGGFGQVYLAKDPESNRKVAIKVPRRDKLTSEESVERFLKEARTAADLVHPAIVQVFDWGRQDDGSCFVVMEYIEGRSLKEVLKTERLGHQQAAEMIAQIAEGLHEAHQREIYHRDVKPANILIDEEGNPHIADFGLAIHEDDRWSHKDELAGTFAYMSPEQVRGKAHRIDGRTDIWSLGAVFYEMLTGRKPFSGDDRDQLLDEIVHRQPKPMRMIDEAIPNELEEICSKCLAKPVENRFSSGKDLATSIRVYTQPKRKRRIPIVAAFVAIAVLIAFVASLALKSSLTNTSEWRLKFPDYGEIVWPGYRGKSDVRDGDELSVMTNDICLIQLGELSGDSCSFSVNIRQPKWDGRVGVFLGFRKEEYLKHESAVFQRLSLQKRKVPDGSKQPLEWEEVYVVARDRVVILPDTASLSTIENMGAEVIPSPTLSSNATLTVEIERSRLKAVYWDGEILENLTTPNDNALTADADYVGAWGLFLHNSSAWFTRPEFKCVIP